MSERSEAEPGSTPAKRSSMALDGGWEIARTLADECPDAGALQHLRWRPARVPGTAAGSVDLGEELDLDADDWWFRMRFDAARATGGEQVALILGGLATIAEVYLNGRRVLESESMYSAHELDVGELLRGDNELAICCRALTPRLHVRRKPRARWRTRLVSEGNLRFFRTMLLGRAPGFAPGPAVVGPWRPLALERRRGTFVTGHRLRARLRDGNGVLQCRVALSTLAGSEMPSSLPVTVAGERGVHTGRLTVEAQPGGDQGRAGTDISRVGTVTLAGTIVIAEPERWWPHTHGQPALYEVRIGDRRIPLLRARVGFRELRAAADLVADGLDLRINGVPVFARGAIWTPLSLRAPHASETELRRALAHVVGAGMNMLRVAGIGTYESETFYDLCDELGILVWQDFMFANLDYPDQDPGFMATVAAEGRRLLGDLGHRPSLAALCGGSEVAQQVAMLGLDPGLADGPLYGELLPGLVGEADVEAPYIPSAPWGGELPFRTDRGVANYYGVGAYLRPLEDARRAEVRFAAECLAFANVPDEVALQALGTLGGPAVHDPAWKAGVPRDAGAGWDFDDVRDHYLRLLFGVDPVALRSVDRDRYLELSRATSGEVMGEVFGEWRREGSPCTGGLVLWLKDHRPGAGWGVLDHRGEPKVALHHLRRALAPVAVWSTDEGLGGVLAHVANDRPEPLRARLRVALYRDFELLVEEAITELDLPAHGRASRGVESLLGRFVDVSWAYRFGPPAQDLIVLSLEREHEGEREREREHERGREVELGHERDGGWDLISQAFRFPAGRPHTTQSATRLGLSGVLRRDGGGRARLTVSSTRFAYGVRTQLPGYIADDDAFGVEPGHERILHLTATEEPPAPPAGSLTALNLAGRAPVTIVDE